MRVLKGKEIEEVDQKVEKDMIELTILEAAETSRSTRKKQRHGRTEKWSEKTSRPEI
jgi:hypothetical protein